MNAVTAITLVAITLSLGANGGKGVGRSLAGSLAASVKQQLEWPQAGVAVAAGHGGHNRPWSCSRT